MLVLGRRTALGAAAAMLCSAGELLAYPIPPVPLLELCRQADTIVVADAVGFVEVPSDNNEESYAELRVNTVYKGTVQPGQTVRVMGAQPYGGHCPAPACYPVGGNGIAFLREDDKGRGFTTIGLSYGSKFVPAAKDKLAPHDIWLTNEELQASISAVARLMEIERLPESSKQTELNDWLVGLTENPAVSFNAFLVLCGVEGYDPYSFEGVNRSDFARTLNANQKRRLAAVLMEQKEIYSAVGCALLLNGYANPQVSWKLVSLLAVRDPDKRLTLTAMKIVVRREHHPFAGSFVRQVEKVPDEGFGESREADIAIEEFRNTFAYLAELEPIKNNAVGKTSAASSDRKRLPRSTPGFQERHPPRRAR
jgi:hypothetical protein